MYVHLVTKYAQTYPHVHTRAGVRKESLPLEGVCYFGTMDICVVFSIKFGAGQLLFIGFDYTTLSQVCV